jgi:hypothetical protein
MILKNSEPIIGDTYIYNKLYKKSHNQDFLLSALFHSDKLLWIIPSNNYKLIDLEEPPITLKFSKNNYLILWVLQF